jgi:serine protease Do
MSRKFLIVGFLSLLLAFGAGLLGVITGGILTYNFLQHRIADAPSVLVEPTLYPEQITFSDIQTAITEAVDKVGPSVVTVVGIIPGQQTFFYLTPDKEVSGSGVIISTDGYVLTNNHVVENVNQVVVILPDGSQIPAEIVGTDIYADLAVLKVDSDLPAMASLGNSVGLKPGETVIAIGSPLGDFKNTVTVGVVSATGRILDTGNGYQMEGLIQTDAAINHGNSGGPLINLNGEVIGVNTLILRGSGFGGDIAEGLGFAIPINTARTVAQQIIQKGYFSRPYLGVSWQPITPRISAAYNLPVDWGAYVTEVYPGGPAEQAGVHPGDIIVQMGDINIDDKHSYLNTLFSYTPGQAIPIQVLRGQNYIQLSVALGESKR